MYLCSTIFDMMKLRFRFPPLFAAFLGCLATSPLAAESLAGVVQSVDPTALRIEILPEASDQPRTVFVGRGDAAILEPGDRISGEIVRQGPASRLQRIFPADLNQLARLQRLSDALHRDTLTRGHRAFRGIGESVPRFALWDQDGDLFLSESLGGRYVVLNFVFTRCAVPEMCPAATQRMIELARELDARGWDDVTLVSVTLDPAYDTPGIWTAYADDRGIDSSRHRLLGGPPEVVEALKKQLGIIAEPDAEQIIRHTLSTTLIDPTGKIIYRLPGSRWSPEVFVRQIERAKES